MSIPADVIERVRDAADVVELIGEHVQLKRTGADYRGPCPFHGGAHRNLAVIPKKQMFYCFVCHEGGDVFTFYMKKLGLDYPTAVREVARRVGIVIPDRATTGPDPLEPLYQAVAVAQEWYARQLRELPEAEAARRYLGERGYQLEELHPYGLGFAPRGPAFLEAMQRLGITPDVLIAAGLALRKDDGTLRARFWGRLLFPIHDLRGRVVGFGGRVLGDGEPKYLNSPDSELFHKGRLLYNLHSARHAVRKAEHAVLVEGYFDVLRLALAGLDNVVAPLGTGFTPDQAELLRRLAPRVTLLFDSDAAGLKATFRAADELLRARVGVAVATMPDGEDPDTLVKSGGAGAVERVLRDAVDVFERKLQLLERKGWLASLSGRRRALDRLLPTLRAASDAVTRDLYVTRVCEALGVGRDSVLREMEERPPRMSDAVATDGPPDRRTAGPERRPSRYGVNPERYLVRAMVRDPEYRTRLSEEIPDRSLLREPERTLFGALASLPADTPPAALFEQLEGETSMLLTALLSESPLPDLSADVLGALGQIKIRPLERELRDVKRRLGLATEDEKVVLAGRVGQLRKEIESLRSGGRWNVIKNRRGGAG
jgi:DNA primase